MYLLYLDESGDASGWQSQRHFVLAGVAVHEGQIHNLDSALQGIQEKYFPGISYPIAFHATEIRRGKGQFSEFTPETREEILKDVYNVIHNTRFPRLIAYATAIHISKVENPLQVRPDTLGDICQRFNFFLIRQHKLNLTTKGLLVIDKNREDEYRQLIAEFRQAGTKYGYLDNIVDIPYFARCIHTRMLQLADFIANAVYQYYERQESKSLDLIIDKFDRRYKDGPLDGLKHITKTNDCTCRACFQRKPEGLSETPP